MTGFSVREKCELQELKLFQKQFYFQMRNGSPNDDMYSSDSVVIIGAGGEN